MTISRILRNAALLLAVAASVRAAENGGSTPLPSPQVQVRVAACQVSEEVIHKLGLDWMVRMSETVGEETVAGLRGLLLPSQYEVIKRELGAAGISVKSLPPLDVAGEARIESPWKKGSDALSLHFQSEADGVQVWLAGRRNTSSIFVNGGQILLYAMKSPEVRGHELYFVSVTADWFAEVRAEGTFVEVGAWIAAIPEEEYLREQRVLDAAVRDGDMARLGAQRSCALMRLPRVSLRVGIRGSINNVREFRYPVEYERGEGMLTPSQFESTDLGIQLSVTPSLGGDGIALNGNLTVRVFDEFTKSEHGAFAPSFHATEANFLRILRDGQTTGFWLPGARVLPAITDDSWSWSKIPKPGEPAREGERTKVALLLSAKQVTYDAPNPESPKAKK